MTKTTQVMHNRGWSEKCNFVVVTGFLQTTQAILKNRVVWTLGDRDDQN
jgi:hypothetical protein